MTIEQIAQIIFESRAGRIFFPQIIVTAIDGGAEGILPEVLCAPLLTAHGQRTHPKDEIRQDILAEIIDALNLTLTLKVAEIGAQPGANGRPDKWLGVTHDQLIEQSLAFGFVCRAQICGEFSRPLSI
jgi:hypothetical protein